MKYFFLFLLFVCMFPGVVQAAPKKHRDRVLPRTEVGLMNNVLGCLANKDSTGYFFLFPPFDTLWSFVIHNPDRSPETVAALNSLKERPRILLQFDPTYNRNIMGCFFYVLKKGEDSGIHWKDIAMERYELYQQEPGQSMKGYEKIAPERFKGYIFVKDMLGHVTYCITIQEIQKISGYFFGGQVLNILEASSVDQFLKKEDDERKYFDWLAKNSKTDSASFVSIGRATSDSAKARNDSMMKAASLLRDSIINDDDNSDNVRKEVINRKFYTGKFDNEISVELYVRYMKDPKSAKQVAYDGLYKFGDQKDYVKLIITKNADGKWEMEDELPLGSMELVLKNKVYTGSWLNNGSQTGYDVLLSETGIPESKMERLDKILEKGLSGRADEDSDDDKDIDNGRKAARRKRQRDDDDE
jgi:hypothetical protein